MIETLEKERVVEFVANRLKLTDIGKIEVERSIYLDVDPPVKLPFVVKVGPIASGNVVVKDGLTWDMLKRMGVRSVVGLEMEAAAIGEISRASGLKQWIVVKGVMDHADPKKDDRYKPFAARASAEVLREFLISVFSAETEKDSQHLSEDYEGQANQTEGSSWRPRCLNGPFFEELNAALKSKAPRFSGLFTAAMACAIDAYDAADHAYEVAGQIRISLGDQLKMAHDRKLKKPRMVLNAGKTEAGRVLIAQVYDSNDEYLGEAFGDISDGYGITRAYYVSEVHTPNLQSSYAGQNENDRYGPIGVYTFTNQAQFAGKWVAGHPNFGYREFFGGGGERSYDFYLGNMIGIPNNLVPNWHPHGEGIAVDAINRKVLCGKFHHGVINTILFQFEF